MKDQIKLFKHNCLRLKWPGGNSKVVRSSKVNQIKTEEFIFTVVRRYKDKGEKTVKSEKEEMVYFYCS